MSPEQAGAGEFTIETRDLNLWYGDFQALKNITVNIKHGIITALIGPSGCGKTTFLRCGNRLNERYGSVRTTGEIRILRKNIYDPDVDLSELRKAVGMVFQRPTPFPTMSIRDNVAAGLQILGRDKPSRAETDHIVEDALKRAALWDEVSTRLTDSAIGLSGGQQQRLCIARALATRPAVLLLDEPTASLDPISTQKVEELVYELRRDMTVVIVTHNMQQAARVSDRTAFMLTGELVEIAATNTLFTTPSDSRTEAYITGRFG